VILLFYSNNSTHDCVSRPKKDFVQFAESDM